MWIFYRNLSSSRMPPDVGWWLPPPVPTGHLKTKKKKTDLAGLFSCRATRDHPRTVSKSSLQGRLYFSLENVLSLERQRFFFCFCFWRFISWWEGTCFSFGHSLLSRQNFSSLFFRISFSSARWDCNFQINANPCHPARALCAEAIKTQFASAAPALLSRL